MSANETTDVLSALSSVDTPTSPNTNVVTTPSGDPNNSTVATFQYHGRTPVWIPTVSQAITSATLSEDRTIGKTTWKKGLKVTYTALSETQYQITLNGLIVDDGAEYQQDGTLLGTFTIPSPKVQEVKAPAHTAKLVRGFFQALPSVNTPTSPNTNVVTTPSGDPNNSTVATFQYHGSTPVWIPTVSQAITSATLSEDRTIGKTTWRKGLRVSYTALSKTQYQIMLNGLIVDDGAEYQQDGTLLGTFTIIDGGSKAGS